MSNYPHWFKPSLFVTLVGVVATGLLLAPTTLAIRGELDEIWRLSAGTRQATAALHAAGAFALLLFTGALWSLHMRSGWRRRRQRASGMGVGLLLLGLSITALGVYYLGDDRLGTLAALLHLGLGITFPVPLAWHWLHGRRIRRRQRTEALAPRHARAMGREPHPNPGQGPALS